jgi:hypothetical protein
MLLKLHVIINVEQVLISPCTVPPKLMLRSRTRIVTLSLSQRPALPSGPCLTSSRLSTGRWFNAKLGKVNGTMSYCRTAFSWWGFWKVCTAVFRFCFCYVRICSSLVYMLHWLLLLGIGCCWREWEWDGFECGLADGLRGMREEVLGAVFSDVGSLVLGSRWLFEEIWTDLSGVLTGPEGGSYGL